MNNRRLLIGTNNGKKIEDFRAVLDSLHLQLLTPDKCGVTDPAPEDADTFEKNSVAKAQFYWGKTHIPCVTDDSGAEIDVLDGAPGVHTRRWNSQVELSDEAIRAKAIESVKIVPEEQRRTQLRNVVTFITGDSQYVQAEGIIAGIIRQSTLPTTPGYPFDSILFLPQYGDWYSRVKRSHPELNHRRQALKKILPQIQQYFI